MTRSALRQFLRMGIGLALAGAAYLAFALWTSRGDDEKVLLDAAQVCAQEGAAGESPLFGVSINDVPLTTLAGRPVGLHALGGPRLTTVLFWACTCPCSNGYIDRLRELRDAYEPKGVAFIGINANSDETADQMQAFIDRRSFPLPVYRDAPGIAADMLMARVTPEVFVFDTTWALRYHGRIDDDKGGLYVKDASLARALDTLLTGGELRHREKPGLGCVIVRH